MSTSTFPISSLGRNPFSWKWVIFGLIATSVAIIIYLLTGDVTVTSRVRPENDAAGVTLAVVTVTEGANTCKASGDVNYAEPGWSKSKSWKTDLEVGEPCSPGVVQSLLEKLGEQFDLKEKEARALFDQASKNIRLHYGLIK